MEVSRPAKAALQGEDVSSPEVLTSIRDSLVWSPKRLILKPWRKFVEKSSGFQPGLAAIVL